MSVNQNLQLQQEPFSGILPQTVASAASLSLITQVAFVTGTVQVATVVPPVRAPHLLTLIFTDAAPGALLTTGNIAVAVTPVTNTALILSYEPRTGKYYPISVGAAGGAAIGGSIADNQVAVGSGVNTIEGSSAMTFDGTDLSLPGAAFVLVLTSALTDGAGAGGGTLLNAPAAGNPTKWIAVNDFGTTRWIPTWSV